MAAITSNPTVPTPTPHQLGAAQQTPSLNTQQLVSQQLALQQLLAYSASYGHQAGSALSGGLPSLTDLQAYNLIATLPQQQSNGSPTASATVNLLNNAVHNSTTNNNLVNQALMRNYISPGTAAAAAAAANNAAQNALKSHNGSAMSPRQIIKLEVCREFQRCACKRSESECRYAHPGPQVHVNSTADGGSQVVVCSNFLLKRGCNRDQNCRFYHPPANLMDQVKQQQQQLINQQLITQQQLQQRAAMMIANQSLVGSLRRSAPIFGSTAAICGPLPGYSPLANLYSATKLPELSLSNPIESFFELFRISPEKRGLP